MSAGVAFVWPGRTRAGYPREGVRDYVERIGRYLPCRVIEVPAERHSGRFSAAHRVEREGRRLAERLEGLADARVVALDPGGRRLDTAGLASWVAREAWDRGKLAAFVVGGPDGLSSLVRDRADLLLALSPLTLPHDLVRLLVAEQVYRILTIERGHPYDR